MAAECAQFNGNHRAVQCANVQCRSQCASRIGIRVKEVQASCAVLRAGGVIAGHLVTKSCAAAATRESIC